MFVAMGEIVKGVGLKGEVKFLPSADFLASVLESSYLRRRRGQDELQPVRVLGQRPKGDTLILKIEGIGDRSSAEAAVGEELGFLAADYERDDFPRPQEPAPFIYWGLRVVTTDGRTVGEVDSVMVLPANLVLQVMDGEKETLIPVIEPIIRELDREKGVLVIEPMPGLLDDDEA